MTQCSVCVALLFFTCFLAPLSAIVSSPDVVVHSGNIADTYKAVVSSTALPGHKSSIEPVLTNVCLSLGGKMVRTASRKLSSDAHVCAFIASAQSFCNCCSHAIVKSLRACTVLVREFITLPSSQLSCSMCPVQNHAGACCNCIRVRLYPISILFFQDLSETLAHFIQDILPQDLGLVLLPDLEYIRDSARPLLLACEGYVM